jgi:hypothetical protein
MDYGLSLFTLDPDKDILDLMVSMYGQPPSWGYKLLFVELDPGESKTYTFVCWATWVTFPWESKSIHSSRIVKVSPLPVGV